MNYRIETGDGSKGRHVARVRGSVGATMVEYALVLALVVVPSVGAVKYFSTQSAKQTNNQADCIAKRPPTNSCQVIAITTTTTTTPASTTSTAPATTTTTAAPTTTTAAPSATLAWDVGASVYTASPRQVTLKLNVTSSPGSTPLPGAVVTFTMALYSGSPPSYVTSLSATCTSDAAGVCSATWAVPTAASQVSATVRSVDSTPPAGTVPTQTLQWSTP